MGTVTAMSKRPRWWAWVRLSGKGLRDHAQALNVSHTHLSDIGLETDSARRAMPSAELKAAIQTYTGGFVNAETDWPPLPAADSGEQRRAG